jgi:hypothetical protein
LYLFPQPRYYRQRFTPLPKRKGKLRKKRDGEREGGERRREMEMEGTVKKGVRRNATVRRRRKG